MPQLKLKGEETNLVLELPHCPTTQSQSTSPSLVTPLLFPCSANLFNFSNSSSLHVPDAPPTFTGFIFSVDCIPPGWGLANVVAFILLIFMCEFALIFEFGIGLGFE